MVYHKSHNTQEGDKRELLDDTLDMEHMEHDNLVLPLDIVHIVYNHRVESSPFVLGHAP